MQIAKSFDLVTLKKIFKSGLLLIGGAALTYIASNLMQLITAFGIPAQYQLPVFGFLTWCLNLLLEWYAGIEKRNGLPPTTSPVGGVTQ